MRNYLKPTNTPQQNQLARRLLYLRESGIGGTENAAKNWLNQNSSINDLRYAIGQFDNKDKKTNILASYIRQTERTLEDFICVAQNNLIGEGIYDIRAIVSCYKSILPPANWVPLFRRLYPNPMSYDLQIEALIDVIHKSDSNQLEEAKYSFLYYLEEIPLDDRALYLLSELQKKVNITPQDLPNAISQHLLKNFQSVAGILQERNVADSLTENGLQNFSAKFSGINQQEVTLAKLFSYYNSRGIDGLQDFEDFITFIKPEIIQKIRIGFTPSDQSVLISITQREKQSLSLLLGTNKAFPIVVEVSEALSKINIENFSADKIEEFRFGDSVLLQGRKKEKKNAQFRALLSKAVLEEGEIANFFKEILMLEGDINSNQYSNLNKFFASDKFLLATLLAKEDGLIKFQSVLSSLGDGCYANIGTHARTAVVDSLVKDDVSKSILFSVFCRDIRPC